MRDEQIEKVVNKLIEGYSTIETDLLVLIAQHFKYNDEFINSDNWRFQKLKEFGLFGQEVIDYLAKQTGVSKERIIEALNQIGIDTIDLPTLNEYYNHGKLKVNPNVLNNNPIITKMINDTYYTVEETFIKLKKTMESSCRKAYLDVVDNAYYKMALGTESYQTAIKQALNDLGNKGIQTLTYSLYAEDGTFVGIRQYDVVGTVRREVMNSARNLSNKIAEETINELQCEYIYLSEHLDCREEHYPWQGTVIKREDLVKVTDYGSITGLGGINCRHYFEPYFGDNKDTKTISQEDSLKNYELKQTQRSYERAIRHWKQKEKIFKANEDKEAQKYAKKKVIYWSNRIDNFCKANKLQREYSRERI